MLCLERKDPRDPQDGVGFIYLNSRSCRKTLKIIESETLSFGKKCWWRNRGSDPVGAVLQGWKGSLVWLLQNLKQNPICDDASNDVT